VGGAAFHDPRHRTRLHRRQALGRLRPLRSRPRLPQPLPPVPRRVATAFRGPSSEGAKECSPRRKPWETDPQPRTSPGGAKETSSQTSAVREQTRTPRHLGESRVPRFSRPVREAGKFADINTNQEGNKRGRARLQSCRKLLPLRFVSLSEGARFAFRIALRSRRIPIPSTKP
jgi:hypothetical protein